jgi:hypothetical protein
MNIERAIKILQEQQAEFNDRYIDYGGVNDAYKMAIEALKEKYDVSKEIYCTDCQYFSYIGEPSDSWYGTMCCKDSHSANPSMYAIQSLHEDCPLRSEVEHE